MTEKSNPGGNTSTRKKYTPAFKAECVRQVVAGGRSSGLAPRYQKVAPAVKELYEAGQQSTRQLVAYFQIGSRRTLYKILRFAGCQINEKSAPLKAK